jgi:hypothetical protein
MVRDAIPSVMDADKQQQQSRRNGRKMFAIAVTFAWSSGEMLFSCSRAFAISFFGYSAHDFVLPY